MEDNSKMSQQDVSDGSHIKSESFKNAVSSHGQALETQQAMEDYKKKLKEKAEAENSNLWQHPFVDVFKHFKILPGSDFKQNKK